MSRLRGAFPTSSNYEVKVQQPFDARMLVNTKADLYASDSWSWTNVYQGMIVSVAKDPVTENNGVYILKDLNNYLTEAAWVKLFDEDSFDLVVTQLEEDLKNYVDGQLGQYSKMHIGELPETGDSQTIYFRELDGNWQEYIWTDNQFVQVGNNGSIDLSNYYTKEEIDAKLLELEGKIPTSVSQLTNDEGYITISDVQSELQSYVSESELETELSGYATQSELSGKQDTLVSGTNIKTINGYSILGEGNIQIQGGSGGDISIATKDTVGGILATDNSTVEGVEAFVDVDDTGKASVKIPSVDETSTPDDVVNLLNTSTLILNGNA